MRTRLLALLALLVTVGIVATGCGGSGSEPQPAPEPAATDAAATDSPPTEAAPATDAAEASTPADPVSVAFLGAGSANTFVQAEIEGAEAAANEFGGTIHVLDGQFDPQVQFAQCQDAITSGKYQAFVVLAVSGPSLVPCVEQAVASGIAVVATNVPIGASLDSVEPEVPGQAGAVLTPVARHAELYVQMVVDACADLDPCEVGYIASVRALPFDATILATLAEAARQHPTVKLVAEGEGQFLADPARKVAQDMLTADPGIDVIAAGGDQMAVGAEQAVDDAGRTGEVVILGGGGSEIATEAVRDGRWFGSTTFVPFDEGKLATEIAIRTARGEQVAEQAIDALAASGLPSTLTQTNLADWTDFAGQWKG